MHESGGVAGESFALGLRKANRLEALLPTSETLQFARAEKERLYQREHLEHGLLLYLLAPSVYRLLPTPHSILPDSCNKRLKRRGREATSHAREQLSHRSVITAMIPQALFELR